MKANWLLVWACLAMGVTLYVEEPYSRLVRSQVIECIEQYVSLTRSHMRWYHLEEKKRYDMRAINPPSMAQVFGQLNEYDPFFCDFSGADDFDQASPYNLVALLDFKTKAKAIGFLTASVPFAFLEQQPPGFFKKMVHQWCQRLRPLHGYAGIYLAFSADRGEAIPNEPLVYPLVKRFPGIEFDSPASVSLF